MAIIPKQYIKINTSKITYIGIEGIKKQHTIKVTMDGINKNDNIIINGLNEALLV